MLPPVAIEAFRGKAGDLAGASEPSLTPNRVGPAPGLDSVLAGVTLITTLM